MSEKIRISQQDFYRLCRWMEGRLDKIASERHSPDTLARAASEALGIGISEHSVRSAAKMTGVRWRKAKDSSIRNNSSRFLARAIRDLYTDLGKQVPEGIIQLARGEPLDDTDLPSSAAKQSPAKNRGEALDAILRCFAGGVCGLVRISKQIGKSPSFVHNVITYNPTYFQKSGPNHLDPYRLTDAGLLRAEQLASEGHSNG